MEEMSHNHPFRRPPRRDHPLPETLEEAERLAASIEQAVSQQTGGRVRNLAVEIGCEEVTLRGSCSTFYTKQQAQHAAMAFPGLGTLNNQIEVL
jgi:osmotically-inducible protein OsmY